MRKTLAILITSVLLVLSFMFSSCKSCDKDNDKDKNTVTDTDKGKNNPDNPATDEDKGEPTLNDSDLTEVGRYLKDKCASDTEIKAMMSIEKEDFGYNIGRVVLNNGHYVYRDDIRDHDGLQTHNNCGLYARTL